MLTAGPKPNPTTGIARLPHRRYRPAAAGTRAGWPGGLLGMLALVVGVEAAVLRAGPRFMDPLGFCWAFTAEAASAGGPKAEVLLVGDSLVKHGLVPRVFRETTGLNAVNLAIPAAPAPATDSVLRRALAAGARPKAVVLDLKAGLLVGGPKYSIRYWPLVLSPTDAARLALSAGGGGFVGELVLGYVLPTFRARHEARADLLAALRGETAPNRALNALGRRQWTVNDGANLGTPRPGYTGDVTEADQSKYVTGWFKPHRVNAAYARRLVGRAVATGARVYLVVPPEVPALAERRGANGSGAAYEAFVRGLQDKFPALTVLDARVSGYPPGAFVDPVHLAANGALALSEDVAAVVRADLSNPAPVPPGRWVRLPSYRERPLPDGLEHVELSRVRARETAARSGGGRP